MTPVFEPPPIASSGTYDNFVLNPVEFTPELPEVSLRDGGIQIGPNAPNLGEATQQVERVRRLIGEGVTGRQLGTVECEIPLYVSLDRDISQAAAYQPLEAFVSDVQKGKICWIRHDFKTVGGFAGSLATFVDNASLPKPYGGEVDELVLHLSRHPIWYATTEILAGEVSGSEVRHLEMELAGLLGTAPGLIRLVVKNEGAEDWRGCMVAIECDSYSSAATAEPHYPAADLTPRGGAEVKTVSGDEVVKCPPLTAGWQTVLSSEIVGTGHMTHVDPRRMIFRINDPSSVLDDVQGKLEWRQNGQAAWVQTMEASTPIVVSSPVIGDYQLLDFGECRPERPVTGDPRFEWRLQMRSLTASGKQPLIRDVYPMTTEQWQRVADASETPIDGEPVKSATTFEDASGVGTAAWAKAEEEEFAWIVFHSAGAEESHYLKVLNPGLAIPAGATPLGIQVAFLCYAGAPLVFDNRVRIIQGGVVKSAQDKALPAIPANEWRGSGSSPLWRIYGGLRDLWGLPWTPADFAASNFGAAIATRCSGAASAGVRKAQFTVAYSEPGSTNRVCFASRSLEFSDHGVRRQHVTDEVWGELIPDGLDLQAPVPGQATQPMRALILPSVGDLAGRPDSATTKPSLKLFARPGYLAAREAV